MVWRWFVMVDHSSGFVFPGCVSVADAVEAFASLATVVSGLDVMGLEPSELRSLTAGVRDGQATLDRLLIRIGVAADVHDDEHRGRGAQGTLLGDGSRVRGHTARKEAARARTARAMNHVSDAVDEGRIGAAQVDAITNAAAGLTPEQQQELNTPEMIDAAAEMPADTFARVVRDEVERIKGDHGLADTVKRRNESRWKQWVDENTGMHKIFAEFDPERGEAISNAVQAQLTRLANEGGLTKDAGLAAEAAFQLLTGRATGSLGVPHISVIVDRQTMSHGSHDDSVRETVGGALLPPESVARLACNAVIQKVVVDERGLPVDVGRKHRTATDAQWLATKAIYRSCAWDGCERPLAWCQLHHIHEWEHGGATDLCNLIPLCNRHHHAVHEGQWSVKLDPDTRRLDIYDPRPDPLRQHLARPGRPPGSSSDQRRRTINRKR